jgi:hypothetical protein
MMDDLKPGRYRHVMTQKLGKKPTYTFEVCCNACGDTAEITFTSYAGTLKMPEELRDRGWFCVGRAFGARWHCPKHKNNAPETPPPA